MVQPTEEPKKSRLEVLEDVVTELLEKVEKLAGEMETIRKTTVKKSAGLFGGRKERVAVKDTKTGIVYVSKAAAGKGLAIEFGLDPGDHFTWYKITSAAPDRLVEASVEEKAVAEKKAEEEQAKWVADENKRLAAEAAKKK